MVCQPLSLQLSPSAPSGKEMLTSRRIRRCVPPHWLAEDKRLAPAEKERQCDKEEQQESKEDETYRRGRRLLG